MNGRKQSQKRAKKVNIFDRLHALLIWHKANKEVKRCGLRVLYLSSIYHASPRRQSLKHELIRQLPSFHLRKYVVFPRNVYIWNPINANAVAFL